MSLGRSSWPAGALPTLTNAFRNAAEVHHTDPKHCSIVHMFTDVSAHALALMLPPLLLHRGCWGR